MQLTDQDVRTLWVLVRHELKHGPLVGGGTDAKMRRGPTQDPYTEELTDLFERLDKARRVP